MPCLRSVFTSNTSVLKKNLLKDELNSCADLSPESRCFRCQRKKRKRPSSDNHFSPLSVCTALSEWRRHDPRTDGKDLCFFSSKSHKMHVTTAVSRWMKTTDRVRGTGFRHMTGNDTEVQKKKKLMAYCFSNQIKASSVFFPHKHIKTFKKTCKLNKTGARHRFLSFYKITGTDSILQLRSQKRDIYWQFKEGVSSIRAL